MLESSESNIDPEDDNIPELNPHDSFHLITSFIGMPIKKYLEKLSI